MAQRFYIISIEDWPRFWDLGIPDEAWVDLGQNADLDTLVEFVDPAWDLVMSYLDIDFLVPLWIE